MLRRPMAPYIFSLCLLHSNRPFSFFILNYLKWRVNIYSGLKCDFQKLSHHIFRRYIERVLHPTPLKLCFFSIRFCSFAQANDATRMESFYDQTLNLCPYKYNGRMQNTNSVRNENVYDKSECFQTTTVNYRLNWLPSGFGPSMQQLERDTWMKN